MITYTLLRIPIQIKVRKSSSKLPKWIVGNYVIETWSFSYINVLQDIQASYLSDSEIALDEPW